MISLSLHLNLFIHYLSSHKRRKNKNFQQNRETSIPISRITLHEILFNTVHFLRYDHEIKSGGKEGQWRGREMEAGWIVTRKPEGWKKLAENHV